MNKARSILHSLRLRTLPLSLSGVILGIILAIANYPENVRPAVIVFTLLTTVCLQILSNLSNELGDYLKGTDNEERIGPMYSLSEGGLTVGEFKRLIAAFAFLCALFGLLMIWLSFGTLLHWMPIAMLLLGGGAIWAAMHYTLGKRPYGYRGLGDLFVFIFFGLVAVMGSYFIIAHTFATWSIVMPAAIIGLFSVGVLNVNNLRDMESDRGTRITIPLKIGERKAKIYHQFLIYGAIFIFFAYEIVTPGFFTLVQLTLPFFICHASRVFARSGAALDKELPRLVIYTFLFSILLGIDLLIGF